MNAVFSGATRLLCGYYRIQQRMVQVNSFMCHAIMVKNTKLIYEVLLHFTYHCLVYNSKFSLSTLEKFLYLLIKAENKSLIMTTQSENSLEQGLIRTLQENSYEYVEIKEEENLRSNFKLQLEKHNRKALEEVACLCYLAGLPLCFHIFKTILSLFLRMCILMSNQG